MPIVNPENAGIGTGNAPQSTSNLYPINSSEKAREMQLKSAKARSFNKEMREAFKLTVADFKSMREEIDMSGVPTGLEFLKYRMVQLMSEGELAQAAEIAKVVAEYEAPKLARVDQTNMNFDASDLSDDELEAELAKLDKKK